MPETLFISDLHLSPQQPAITQIFQEFMQHRAIQADALYILGDLFEVWLGDDDNSAFNQAIITTLRHLVDRGVVVYLMPGNRDFLLGTAFAAQSGCHLLTDDFHRIDCYGTPTVLTHGDGLCTDDIEHQQFRAQYRNPAWQQAMLALPLAERMRLANQYRQLSQHNYQMKNPEIMDVNPTAVERVMQDYGVYQLIHGHTHRAAIHSGWLQQHPTQRIVLAAWHTLGNALSYTPDRLELIYFAGKTPVPPQTAG